MGHPDIVQAGPHEAPGTFYVRSPETNRVDTWQVGERYVLKRVLGEGSFSCVCEATDLDTCERVAVKRVGDVLASIDNAKRVLREVAILRRLSHPNIVSLHDIFTRPASTGRLVYRGGKLVPTSIDLYLVMEYCDQGDLFHLRGQMSESDVQFIMWQLLEVLRYIHACEVWHRDIKSANILISLQEGRRIAKLCDFGSARSASKMIDASSRGKENHEGASGHMVRPDSYIVSPDTSFDVAARMQQEQAQQQGALIAAEQHVRQQRGLQQQGRAQAPPPPPPQQQQQQLQEAVEEANWKQRHQGAEAMQMDGTMDAATAGMAARANGPHPLQCTDSWQQPSCLPQANELPLLTPLPNREVPLALDMDADRQGPPADRGAAVGVRMSDLFVRPSSKPRGGYDQPLTRAVCTPCYRAPEVVMSHGQYSSALDVWSLGCVYGELLQRVPYPGKSATPHLQVAPVIAVTGMPVTPQEGDRYEGPGNAVTTKELAALFQVVGTPSWGTVDHIVHHPAWHAYLRRIPGRPSQLWRRFGASGDAAVDLLSRLLEFDPTRRVTAEEAQQHAYFDALKQQMELWVLEEVEEDMQQEQQQQEEGGSEVNRDVAMAAPDEQPAPGSTTADMVRSPSHTRKPSATTDLITGLPSPSPSPGKLRLPAAAFTSPSLKRRASLSRSHSLCAPSPAPDPATGVCEGECTDPHHVQCVAKVLAGLEVELTQVVGVRQVEAATTNPSTDPATARTNSTTNIAAAGGNPTSKATAARLAQVGEQLRAMLEREVTEHQQLVEQWRQHDEEQEAAQGLQRPMHSGSSEGLSDMEVLAAGPYATGGTCSSGGISPKGPLQNPAFSGSGDLAAHMAEVAASGPAALLRRHTMPGLRGSAAHRQYRQQYKRLGINRQQWALRPDPGNSEDPSDIGKERMPHHRDAEQAGVAPEQHLRAGRHQEWVPTSLVDSLKAGGGEHAWGVTLAPPGMQESELTPGLLEAIRQQHAR